MAQGSAKHSTRSPLGHPFPAHALLQKPSTQLRGPSQLMWLYIFEGLWQSLSVAQNPKPRHSPLAQYWWVPSQSSLVAHGVVAHSLLQVPWSHFKVPSHPIVVNILEGFSQSSTAAHDPKERHCPSAQYWNVRSQSSSFEQEEGVLHSLLHDPPLQLNGPSQKMTEYMFDGFSQSAAVPQNPNARHCPSAQYWKERSQSSSFAQEMEEVGSPGWRACRKPACIAPLANAAVVKTKEMNGTLIVRNGFINKMIMDKAVVEAVFSRSQSPPCSVGICTPKTSLCK